MPLLVGRPSLPIGPKTHKAAQTLAEILEALARKTAPRLEVAVIADIQNYTKLGFCVCSANRGAIQVFGIPASDAYRGNRIYVQGVGPEKNQRYVWQATAVACAPGNVSGSIVMQHPVPVNATFQPSQHNFPLMPTSPHPRWTTLNEHLSNYVAFFFLMPSLPGSAVTLWEISGSIQTPAAGGFYTLKCKYLPDGTIALYYIADYPSLGENILGSIQSTQALSAGTDHFVIFQFQTTSDASTLPNPIAIDGFQDTGTGQALATSSGNFQLGTSFLGTYSLITFLNSFCRNEPCPAGTWISKFGIGLASYSGQPQLPIAGVPSSDTDVPNGRSAVDQGLITQDLWLNQFGSNSSVGNSPGQIGLSLPDSGVNAQNLTLDTYYCSGQTTGPW